MGYEDIGSRIKWRRQQLDMSAADLAAKLSLSKATIHRYENGEIRNIKMPVVVSISRALKCNPAWLVGKSDNMKDGEHLRAADREMINAGKTLSKCNTFRAVAGIGAGFRQIPHFPYQ